MSNLFYTTKLSLLYGPQQAPGVERRLLELIDSYRGKIPVPPETSLTHADAMLITYGDQVQAEGQPPLRTLAEFCEKHLHGLVNSIHLLPFYPWSSDDGFSVKDYRAVDAALGTWEDIERLAGSFRLMFDGVINHASTGGEWFKKFLADESPYHRYFLTVTGHPDLSQVVRPRALPLLTEFETAAGPRQVWTTFSADQADLDYHNPDVLLEILDILLMFARRGAQFIRLDAIAYLWKEMDTTCIHLPQTHAIIQLIRAVLNEVAPWVRLITETNVPHPDNISYFGDGTNEAQLVYNFALPPLVLHTLRVGDAAILSEWASSLDLPSDQVTFFNFLASHDGIGLNPARGILSSDDIEALVEQIREHGGLISYKQNPDGSQSPYEMNISFFDALSDPMGGEPIHLQMDRFMAAQAILLALRGLPGIYFHSLFGSRNWLEGVELTRRNRTINRQKLLRSDLEAELSQPDSIRAMVFERYSWLLKQRSDSQAFHPHGGQKILDYGRPIFAVLRNSPAGDEQMLCLQNVTSQPQTVAGRTLHPYETLWLKQPGRL